MQYAQLEDNSRRNVRTMLREALNLADDVQKGIQAVANTDQRLKFENILNKKCKELAVLGNSLVYKEKEVLMGYKNKLEQTKMDKNRGYEKKALLEETDSDEEQFSSMQEEEEEKINLDDQKGTKLKNQRTFNSTREDSGEDEEAQPNNLLLQEEDEFKMLSTADYMQIRGSKIEKVAKSLGLVHKMY